MSRQRPLLLDRDGVINERIPNGYVINWQDFRFIPGVLEFLSWASGIFWPICVVTNQQGVAKGLMSQEALENIHTLMVQSISAAGGRIDGVYACTEQAGVRNGCRKPGTSMADWIKSDFPQIHLNQAIMVGDTVSDMEFSRRINALPVYFGSSCSVDAAVQFHSFETISIWLEGYENENQHF